MNQSIIGKLEQPLAAPSHEAFRIGVLATLGRASDSDLFAESAQATAQLPYAAGCALAQAARKDGRELELLIPAQGAMDVDPQLTAAYGQGWSLGQRSGPAPLLAPPGRATPRDRWINESRRRGFFDARSASQSASRTSSWGWFGERTTVPVLGSIPNWGVAAGIMGVSMLAGYYFTKQHSRSAFSIL